MSYYNTIATINSVHKIYLVQHRESGKIYIKKILEVYNPRIYKYLIKHHITGIPRLYNIYEENRQLILIEEFISGLSLQEMIDSRALTRDLIIRFMGELCDILEKLHMLNPPIIHRDIKPSNIIITPYNHVVLIDFNAAKYLTDTDEHDTVLLGTKGYAAPEQYGFGGSTPQTDIYALGILLKELSFSLPIATSIFDAIIRKCTKMNPSDRMKTVQELKTEIEKLQTRSTKKPQHTTVFATWQNLLPPGFRTKTPWKMLTAFIIYICIFWSCLTLEVKDATVFHLWLERITALFMMLSIVFCCFNYRNIHQLIPLCANRHRLIRYSGVLVLNFAITFLLFFVMFLLESIF
ncbi:serine/threonine protein kinase [bacterium 1xD42-62]|uniref:non-specific serine/threonine protein kinase n=1 Tax=Parablautia muri TaxID=2320879 RepID=A0A9X5BH22_9FIRM|nr:serine/threonine protein kinase [Parablautia muri]